MLLNIGSAMMLEACCAALCDEDKVEGVYQRKSLNASYVGGGVIGWRFDE